MISRIKKIQQVGTFRNFTRGGSVKFNTEGNLAIIYGNNRCGKTTLVSILKSLGESDPAAIEKRASIPRSSSNSNQYVELSFINHGASEKTVKFSNPEGWKNNSLKNKVVVFDESFVHENVMLGGAITRENQENMINLILGKDAVKEYDETRGKISYAIRCLDRVCRDISGIVSQDNAETKARFRYHLRNVDDNILGILQVQSRELKYLLRFIQKEDGDSDEELSRKSRHLRSSYHFARIHAERTDNYQMEDFDDIREKIEDLLKSHKVEEIKADKILSDEFETLNKSIRATIGDIGQAIRRLEGAWVKIVDQQSRYLESIHESLNDWLDHFGSSEFKVRVVNKGLSEGNKRTKYRLQVEYEGSPIDTTDLLSIFSESDKRNLALALFMTLIEGEKGKIIVLDDPVVSLDDNSITNICTTLKNEAQKHKQVIIVTHYRSLLEKMHDIKTPATYIEIIKGSDTSLIRPMDIGSFCRSPLEKRHDEIDEFIKGSKQPDIYILRQFLEESLKTRFMKHLKESGAHNKSLDKIIKELKQQNRISDKVADQINDLKNSLNPDYHKIKDNNREDIKNIARSLFKLVYEKIGVL